MENTLNYKNYFANVYYSVEDKILYGKIEGIVDLVTFQSESAAEIEQAFKDAVDDYLDFCAEVGKEPDKAYKGTFNVRIDPELHREIALQALRSGRSLNQEVETAICEHIGSGHKMQGFYMASIDSRLSEITGALGKISTSCQITHMEPGYSYVTTVVPQTETCWSKETK